MLIIIAKLVHTTSVPETENQFIESEEVLRFFHTEDITIDKETAQARIYNALIKEYGNEEISENFSILTPEDINIQFSTEI